MKRCQIISIALCLILFSCNKSDNENPLKLDKPILEFPATGGTAVATLENHSSWQINGLLETIGSEESQYIACEPDENGVIHGEWYSIKHTDNPEQISITLKPNTGETRKIAIVVTVGNDGIDLLARQAAGEPEAFSVQWDSFIDNSAENTDIFIGTKYIGIQGWPLVANPPYTYVGATFPKNAFASSFDEEVKGNKQPLDLTFNFPAPYTTGMEEVKGTDYLKKLKEAMSSEEYKSYTPPTRPYIAKLAKLNSLVNLDSCFSENKDFGNTFERIAKQEFELENVKSLSVGEIVFKGFTVSMETPSNGLFVDTPTNLSDLVYIRTLTYGVTAYFVIASEHSYQDVLTAFKGDDYKKPEGILQKSQIILLTVSDVNQEATIKSSFDDLKEFVNKPFSNKEACGYPIFCKGFYAKNNEVFVKKMKNK